MVVAPKSEIEDRAARVVSEALGATTCRRDEGQGVRIRDFDVVYPDGRCEPLEVTSLMDEAWISFLATVNETSASWENPDGLNRCWLVHLDPSAKEVKTRLKGLSGRVIPLLCVLEANGVDRALGRHDDSCWNRANQASAARANRELVQLGVERAVSADYPADATDRFVGVVSGSGTVVDPDILAQVAEELASKTDNLEKLTGFEDAAYRHLAIVVTTSVFEAWRPLQPDVDLPPAVPVLPEPINSVWLISPGGYAIRFSDGAWTRVG